MEPMHSQIRNSIKWTHIPSETMGMPSREYRVHLTLGTVANIPEQYFQANPNGEDDILEQCKDSLVIFVFNKVQQDARKAYASMLKMARSYEDMLMVRQMFVPLLAAGGHIFEGAEENGLLEDSETEG